MSVRKVEFQSALVADTVDITWNVAELYRQTAIEESAETSTTVAKVGGRGKGSASQPLPSTKEVISIAVDGKKPSGDHSAKWHFSLSYQGGDTGEWTVSMVRESSAHDSVIAQLEMKILNRDGTDFWKNSTGPFWVRPLVIKINGTKPPYCGECGYYHNMDKPCYVTEEVQNEEQKENKSEVKKWSIGNALAVHDVLVNGSLKIHIHLEQLDRQGQCVQKASVAKVTAENKVGENLLALLSSGDDADVEIKVKGEGVKVFKAHRCILGARSLVLKRMFATDMKEKCTGLLEVNDISSDAVLIILKYIYSGVVDLKPGTQNKVVRELIYAATKWELDELKELVGLTLVSWCTPKNAMDLLEFAEDHHVPGAVNDIKNFIQNNIKDVLAARGPSVETTELFEEHVGNDE